MLSICCYKFLQVQGLQELGTAPTGLGVRDKYQIIHSSRKYCLVFKTERGEKGSWDAAAGRCAESAAGAGDLASSWGAMLTGFPKLQLGKCSPLLTAVCFTELHSCTSPSSLQNIHFLISACEGPDHHPSPRGCSGRSSSCASCPRSVRHPPGMQVWVSPFGHGTRLFVG